MYKNRIFIFVLFFLLGNTVTLFSQKLPRVMYVNSREGLNQRKAPSLDGEKIGSLLHGTRVVVYEKSISVVIDGITNFWYRISGISGGWSWVFGGYLSEEMPLDVEPILGMWNTDQGERLYWSFRPDHKMSSGRKETDVGIYGNWNLSGNKLTIILIPTEFTAYTTEETIVMRIEIIDRNNIILLHNDGKIEQLTRNNELV